MVIEGLDVLAPVGLVAGAGAFVATLFSHRRPPEYELDLPEPPSGPPDASTPAAKRTVEEVAEPAVEEEKVFRA